MLIQCMRFPEVSDPSMVQGAQFQLLEFKIINIYLRRETKPTNDELKECSASIKCQRSPITRFRFHTS